MGRWSPALIRQVDRRTQQLHWYLLIDLITVRWWAARTGHPGSLIIVIKVNETAIMKGYINYMIVILLYKV